MSIGIAALCNTTGWLSWCLASQHRWIDGSLPRCIAFCGPEEMLPWCQQVPETSHVDLKHAYGERVCGWTILRSMRKQFLYRSRHDAKVIVTSFLHAVWKERSFLSQFGQKQGCRRCAHQVQIWWLALPHGRHHLQHKHRWNELYFKNMSTGIVERQWSKMNLALTPDQTPYQHWNLSWRPLLELWSSLVQQ